MTVATVFADQDAQSFLMGQINRENALVRGRVAPAASQRQSSSADGSGDTIACGNNDCLIL